MVILLKGLFLILLQLRYAESEARLLSCLGKTRLRLRITAWPRRGVKLHLASAWLKPRRLGLLCVLAFERNKLASSPLSSYFQLLLRVGRFTGLLLVVFHGSGATF
jgi:hypothetical protein